MVFKLFPKARNLGLLLLRLGFGALFAVVHGWPKITGGVELWTKLGGTMGELGVGLGVPAVVWGFLCAFAEFAGGLSLLLGLYVRPMMVLLLVNLLVAGGHHLHSGDGWGTASHALEDAAVCLGLIFIGPGAWSLDRMAGDERDG